MAGTRKKTTVYLDPELLRAGKVVAANSGRHDYEILEDAPGQYLSTAHAETSRKTLHELLGQLGARALWAIRKRSTSPMPSSTQAKRLDAIASVIERHPRRLPSL